MLYGQVMPSVGHDFTAVLSVKEPSDSKTSSQKMERVFIFVRTDVRSAKKITYSLFAFVIHLLFGTTKAIFENLTKKAPLSFSSQRTNL